MRTFIDAKAMAKSLREALGQKQIELSHSDCLELVARQFSADSWNVLAAKIAAEGGSSPAAGGVRLADAIPILRIFSVEKAKEFYVDFLGFVVDWERHFDDNSPAYMQLSRGDLILHLTEHYGDCCPGSTVFVWMTGIEEFHREIAGKNYKYLRPGLETTFYDAKCVQVIDPFGNRIRFNEDLKPAQAP